MSRDAQRLLPNGFRVCVFVGVCVYMCVYERARKREKERELCVCGCLDVGVCILGGHIIMLSNDSVADALLIHWLWCKDLKKLSALVC